MIEAPVRGSSVESDPVVPRRPLRSRFSMAHLVMVLAGLVAFVLVLVALSDRSEDVHVSVAAIDVEQGTRLSAASIQLIPVPAEAAAALGDLVDADEMQAALDEGAVAARTLPAGTTLRVTDLRRGDDPASPERIMSVEIDAARAAGGLLVSGDVVDIVASSGDEAEVVASGVDVVAVSSGNRGFAAASLVLSLAVDPPTALRLVAAVASGEVFVLRATGAEPFAPGAGP